MKNLAKPPHLRSVRHAFSSASIRGGRSLFDQMPSAVRVVDVSPRDGLQNEKTLVCTSTKVELVSRLVSAGVSSVEVAAFVSPKMVPQMKDGAAVLKQSVKALAGGKTQFVALVPNLKGLEAAICAGVQEVTVLAAATETMSRRNTNCSIKETTERALAVISAAKKMGVRSRGAIAVSMVCPYEGDVPLADTAGLAEMLHAAGCDEIVICDTIGKATPGKTSQVLEAVLGTGIPASNLSLHVHDTYGQALANVLVGLRAGISTFDASVGGLGGCPFAGPGASGNLATEDLVFALDGLGIETGIDVSRLAETGSWICEVLGRKTGSKAGAALLATSHGAAGENRPFSLVSADGAVPNAKIAGWGESGTRTGPLAGVRVLELGNFVAGPYCATSLAYFGADVIKVETPGKGDPIRYLRFLCEDGQSAWSRSLLRNKRSLTLNLKHPDGFAIAQRLINGADVVVENFRPGVLEKLGLNPDKFTKSNPGLVFARISGYGQTGPYSHRPGFASAAEGEGGLRYVNGFPDQTPVRANLSLGDSLAGLHAALGVVMALFSRAKTGKGQIVDTALYEAVFNMMEGVIPECTSQGPIRQPSGTTVSGIVPTNTHRCGDGKFVVIGANSDEIFRRTMECMGRKDMADDPRYRDNASRVQHEKVIYQAIDEWCLSLTLNQVLEKLSAAGCPSGPIYDAADMLNDPHFIAREMFEDIETPTGLRFKIPAMVPKLTETPGATEWCGAQVGAHNRQVLETFLGFTPEKVQQLQGAGAVGTECEDLISESRA